MLCKSCGLLNPFIKLHTHSAPPATYIRGKSRIDYILISTSILLCFLDFPTLNLFNDHSHPIAPLSRQGLQPCNPRLVGKYYDTLHEQLAYHNVEERLQVLYDSAKDQRWTPDQTLDYENLDRCITESMLHAERQASWVTIWMVLTIKKSNPLSSVLGAV